MKSKIIRRNILLLLYGSRAKLNGDLNCYSFLDWIRLFAFEMDIENMKDHFGMIDEIVSVNYLRLYGDEVDKMNDLDVAET